MERSDPTQVLMASAEVVLFKANARVGKYRFGLRLEQELANFSVKVQIKFAKLFGSHGLCHNCAK